MTTTALTVDTTLPGHREAMILGATEQERFLEVLRNLRPEDWTKPTDCSAWDVRAMVAHSLGSVEANASLREMAHQMRIVTKRAKATGNLMVDEMTALQINERASMTPAEVLRRFETTAPRAIAGRRRMPALVRRNVKIDAPPPFERMTLGYLCDTIFTRDMWMHRIDICRATGQPISLTADHDGRLVAAIVGEWAQRHDNPYDLVLIGTAGGHFRRGEGGEHLELDAVEFCRILSGREPGSALGLMSVEVLF